MSEQPERTPMTGRPSPAGRRALLALYRNHPATGPGDRYNWKAYAEARRLRDMLLAWAATKPDEELLWCRNLGPVALRWIREQTGDPPSPFADLEAENNRMRQAAKAVLEELDIIRAHPHGRIVVHIDTHKALRAALAERGTE